MIYNICTKKEYTTKDGEQKTLWYTIGELKEYDGKKYMTMYATPNEPMYVFEREQKKKYADSTERKEKTVFERGQRIEDEQEPLPF
jgi:hypothetical protein